MKKELFLYFIILIFIPDRADAELFKCLYRNGNVTFSNIPCPENTKSEVLENFGSYSNQVDDSNEVNPQGLVDSIEKTKPVQDGSVKNIIHISSGERVILSDYMSYGRYTVFLFYAPWCPSCRKARPEVHTSVNENDNIVLREINVVDWKSEVQKQHRIPAIPYFKLYDPSGVLVSEGTGTGSQTYKYISNPQLLEKL